MPLAFGLSPPATPKWGVGHSGPRSPEFQSCSPYPQVPTMECLGLPPPPLCPKALWGLNSSIVSIIYWEIDTQAHTVYFSYKAPMNTLQLNSLEVFQQDFSVPRKELGPLGSCGGLHPGLLQTWAPEKGRVRVRDGMCSSLCCPLQDFHRLTRAVRFSSECNYGHFSLASNPLLGQHSRKNLGTLLSELAQQRTHP